MDSNDWFNDNVKLLSSCISLSKDFIPKDTPANYTNVLSSFKTSNKIIDTKKFNIKVFDNFVDDNKPIIVSHKYQIYFTKDQRDILVKYFNEAKVIYDLCVDVWKKYNDCTSNWQILKDVVFQICYRNENSKNLNKDDKVDLIVKELKLKQKQFEDEQNKYKEEYDKQKLINKEKFKLEMIKHKELVEKNINNTIKDKLVKPKLDKIKFNKIKNPPKPKGKVVKKPAPDEVLKSEIKTFCVNLSNERNKAYENIENIDIDTKKLIPGSYKLSYKDISEQQTISIDERGLSEKGIYNRSLGKIEDTKWPDIVKKYKLNKECKLTYDKLFNKYYLHIVSEKDKINIENRKEIVALDPGEKIFNYFYSNEQQGKLGDNMRAYILTVYKQIKKLQSDLKKKKNKKGKKIKNKKALKRKIQNLYSNIKNYVNEIHKKSAKFLCENYKNILLPSFDTKPMISNKKYKELKSETKTLNKEEGRKEIIKIQKQKKLSNNVKFVLQMQSHYKFKIYLKALAKRYGTNVHEVNESYTSLCCTYCGLKSTTYVNRIKECIGCKQKLDRDENGSRNIYMKSICSKTR